VYDVFFKQANRRRIANISVSRLGPGPDQIVKPQKRLLADLNDIQVAGQVSAPLLLMSDEPNDKTMLRWVHSLGSGMHVNQRAGHKSGYIEKKKKSLARFVWLGLDFCPLLHQHLHSFSFFSQTIKFTNMTKQTDVDA